MSGDGKALAIDFDSLTRAQQEVLGWIAIGLDNEVSMRRKTIKTLLGRGLIEAYDEVLPAPSGKPGWLTVYLKRYFVPIPVHIQWAYWAAQSATEEDPG